MIKKIKNLNINIIEFNRPSKANAFNGEIVKSIVQKLKLGEKNKSKFHLFIGSHGYFSSGADLDWILNEKTGYEELLKMYNVLRLCKKPIISIVDGKCFGGGLGFLALSDLVIAKQGSVFCLPEARYNMTPGIFSEYLINKIGRTHFFNLSASASKIDTNLAFVLGLVNEVYSKENFEKYCLAKLKILVSRQESYLKVLKNISNQKNSTFKSMKRMMILNQKLMNE